jgi:hypothetical protein
VRYAGRYDVCRWRRACGGRAALAPKGAGGAKCKLTAAQVAELEGVLDAGPAAAGYDDQCWTLARITDQVWRRFGAGYAALIAVKAGQQPRLIYRVHQGGRRRGETRKGFTEADYARLLDAAHQQLGGPLVLVWDNLTTHVSRAMANWSRAGTG